MEAAANLRTDKAVITANTDYRNEARLKKLAETNIDAYLPDNGYRQRDERYAGQNRHKAKPDPLYDKRPKEEMITRHFATVEPVFGNLRGNKRLDRFTLRESSKINGQWKLCCLTRNIEKRAHHGYGKCWSERRASPSRSIRKTVGKRH